MVRITNDYNSYIFFTLDVENISKDDDEQEQKEQANDILWEYLTIVMISFTTWVVLVSFGLTIHVNLLLMIGLTASILYYVIVKTR